VASESEMTTALLIGVRLLNSGAHFFIYLMGSSALPHHRGGCLDIYDDNGNGSKRTRICLLKVRRASIFDPIFAILKLISHLTTDSL